MYNPKNYTGEKRRDLECLHPVVAFLAKKFIEEANKVLEPKGYYVKPVSTLRTWSEQAAIYAQGRTAPGKRVTDAPPGRSIHNWGCAFDLGVFKGNEYIDNTKPAVAEKIHQSIAPIGKKLGLFWGGDFISLTDNPHYQYTGEYYNNDFLAKVNSGSSVDSLLDPLGDFINKLIAEGKI